MSAAQASPFSGRVIAGLDLRRPRRDRSLAADLRLRRQFGVEPRRARPSAFGRRHRLQGADDAESAASAAARSPTARRNWRPPALLVVTIEPQSRQERHRPAARSAPRPADAADPAEMAHHARSVASRLGARHGARRGHACRRADRLPAERQLRLFRRAGADAGRRGKRRWPAFRCLSRAPPRPCSGAGLRPLLSAPGGGALLAQLGDEPHYVVADPDLFNNHGLKDPAAARAALAPCSTRSMPTDAARSPSISPSTASAPAPAPNLLRTALRAALPGDDAGAGRRRPARRAARRLPLRPGRGARSARSRSARRPWSRTAPA